MELVESLPLLHPGEVLRKKFLRPLELSAYAVAKACGVPRTGIERIANEKLGITGDTALRLVAFSGQRLISLRDGCKIALHLTRALSAHSLGLSREGSDTLRK